MESGFQQFAANLYPSYPNPESAIGLPAHSNHGLLTFLIENGIGGLQIYHNNKWVNANAIPNAFFVNIGDHMEVIYIRIIILFPYFCCSAIYIALP